MEENEKNVKIGLRKDSQLKEDKKKKIKSRVIYGLGFSFFILLVTLFFTRGWIQLLSSFVFSFLLFNVYFILKNSFENSLRIRKMEDVFPDFIELMASNLRAGMTIDRALLLSSRKEFSPLDIEILALGKDILTGKEINVALLAMADRIKSDKISKTIIVINSGIKSGGNLAIILEQTAANMRERGFIEKRAASNVLMYLIFIFFAVAVGAPALFALSSVLVEILSSILGNIPQVEASTRIGLPFTLSSINVSIEFIIYFSMVFLFMINVLASLLLGLVSKGEERAGARYILPLTVLSLTVFFVVRTFISSRFSGLLS